jgi:type VI protein secretion system component VasF
MAKRQFSTGAATVTQPLNPYEAKVKTVADNKLSRKSLLRVFLWISTKGATHLLVVVAYLGYTSVLRRFTDAETVTFSHLSSSRDCYPSLHSAMRAAGLLERR